MRKSKSETAETRKRIVAMAAGVFLEKGLAATGVADIMAAAGLTQGGFYRHFESKEQLIAEASAAAFERSFELFGKELTGLAPRAALTRLVQLYLTQRQCQDAPLCPVAHLCSELPHADAGIRAAAQAGQRKTVEVIAGLLRASKCPDPQGTAQAIAAILLGAVTLARLADSAAAADQILRNAEQAAELIAGAAQPLSQA